MNMKMASLSFLSFLLFAGTLFSQIDSISNIRTSQRTDGSKIVDIYYDLAGPEYYYNIEVQVSFDQGNVFETIDSLSGDHGIGVQPGFDKHMLWHAGKEMPDQYQTNTLVKILSNTDYMNCSVSKIFHDGLEYGTRAYEGRCWLDRNLGATVIATWPYLDSASFGHAYQWGRLTDGHQFPNSNTTSNLSVTDEPGHNMFIINSTDWRNPPNNDLWQGVDGINNPCPPGFRVPTKSEWDPLLVNYLDMIDNLLLPYAGIRFNSGWYSYWVYDPMYYDFVDTYYWTSTLSGDQSYAAFWHFVGQMTELMDRSNGFAVRCIADNSDQINPPSPLQPSNDATEVSEFTHLSWTHNNIGNVVFDVFFGTTTNPPLVEHQTFSNSFIPGILDFNTTYYWRVVAVYPSGIAAASDLWSFTTRDFTCGSSIIEFDGLTYNTISYVNRCWLDRNVGAQTAATSHNDPAAYGDYYQWGRLKDGHQSVSSPVSSDLSNSNSPGHGNFIVSGTFPYDWRSPQNDSLWQGEFTINNPCPQGWGVPSAVIWQKASNSWNTGMDAFMSPLKLSSAGFRNGLDGTVLAQGNAGNYWARTSSGPYSANLFFNQSNNALMQNSRSNGYPVRCIKSMPIEKPTAIFPANNELVHTKHVILNWSCQNPDGDQLYYDIYFGQDSTLPLKIEGYNDTIYNPGILDYNTTYFWRIIAKDKFGKTHEGDIWVFKVDQFNCGVTTLVHQGLIYGTVSYAGYCWLDRNLGALQVAQSPSDSLSYGDIYQWGRLEDGHENPYSGTTTVIASSTKPGHNNFIVHHINFFTFDWMDPPHPGRWQGVEGINNPCPAGWHVPSEEIWEQVVENIPSDPFDIPLKIPLGGYRNAIYYYNPPEGGLINERGVSGRLWSSLGYGGAIFGTDGAWMGISPGQTNADGLSVRCVKYEWQCGNQLVDDRDGQSYNTIQIGEQCWMAENINIGAMIPNDSVPVNNEIIEKYCYLNNESYCDTYGGLYNWNEMMNYTTTEGLQGICPDGWHVPTDAEWCDLENYADDFSIPCDATLWRGSNAGYKLKSQTGWNSSGNGNDFYSFSVLPAGYRHWSSSAFNFETFHGWLWTSSVIDNNNSRYRGFSWDKQQVYRSSSGSVLYGFSVRCIKD